jgi:hypothetical protein
MLNASLTAALTVSDLQVGQAGSQASADHVSVAQVHPSCLLEGRSDPGLSLIDCGTARHRGGWRLWTTRPQPSADVVPYPRSATGCSLTTKLRTTVSGSLLLRASR